MLSSLVSPSGPLVYAQTDVVTLLSWAGLKPRQARTDIYGEWDRGTLLLTLPWAPHLSSLPTGPSPALPHGISRMGPLTQRTFLCAFWLGLRVALPMAGGQLLHHTAHGLGV